MCGRYAQRLPPDQLAMLYRSMNVTPNDLRPSWNVAPSQNAPVIRRRPDTGERQLDPLRWGLIPHFTSDLKGSREPINARAETIASSGIFRGAFAARRCLVPTSAWYAVAR